MPELEQLSEEQVEKLEKALVNRIASNLTFSELIDIVTSLSVNEVSKQLSEMSEEEKLKLIMKFLKKACNKS
jgi:flagellar motility protein MotE (MotC chaperone)